MPSGVTDRLRRVAAVARGQIGELFYERRFGLDTSASVHLPEHGGDTIGYQAAGWRMQQRWLPRHAVSASDVFLDVGCGKGRAVFQVARRHALKRVIGLELSAELAEVARRNIERNRARLRCTDVEIVVADARQWPIPDDVTIVYLFNPFRGAIFETFTERLLESVDRRPRRVRILYVNPTERDVLERTGRVRLVRTNEGSPASWLRRTAGSSDLTSGVRLYELLPR
jgi:SAM-dependent methyltransferase